MKKIYFILICFICGVFHPAHLPGGQECVEDWSIGVLEWWSDGEKEDFYISNTPTLHYSNTPEGVATEQIVKKSFQA